LEEQQTSQFHKMSGLPTHGFIPLFSSICIHGVMLGYAQTIYLDRKFKKFSLTYKSTNALQSTKFLWCKKKEKRGKNIIIYC